MTPPCPIEALEPFEAFSAALAELSRLAEARFTTPTPREQPFVAPAAALDRALVVLPDELPEHGLGLSRTTRVLLDDVAPALNPGQAGSRYFGFVTGGVLPSAAVADQLVTILDANVQVHLPTETVATLVEVHALKLTLSLLSLPVQRWTGTVTTGATSSNVLALACGRDAVLKRAMAARGHADWDMAEDGLADAPAVTVYVALPHASIKKAAAIVGIGRARVVDLGQRVSVADSATAEQLARARAAALDFDLDALEVRLAADSAAKQGAIVVVGMSEVNTGALAAQTPALRQLCDRYGAWLHIDAAFGAFASLVPGFEWVAEHLNLADSITSDAHKQLNVPYDCGLLFVQRHSPTAHHSPLDELCGPGRGSAPAYLAAPPKEEGEGSTDPVLAARREYLGALPSPLFRNIENSRRFRALPLYAVLLSQGREGFRELVLRNVAFARRLEAWLRAEPCFDVLTPQCDAPKPDVSGPQPWCGAWGYTIVLFAASSEAPTCFRGEGGGARLAQAIKDTQLVYMSATVWGGQRAVRAAISNWSTGTGSEDLDFTVTTEALRTVMRKAASSAVA
ncbi:PLP-dependent transferase [Tilletiopsis washingtonensis]|uniref:PLP-dependent transferase n=1 Tax=Tilletiopsis washingtonensis TaxID=58919 RepID=A0A316ZH92_9BASI|nr:PLP-dependent transferase [Tilletiopsis washingtonensis]PWO00405.1 PLP-dependent transferase [Tilletiopsis washingtonensis]